MRGLVLAVALAVGLAAPWQARAAPPPLEAYGQLPTIEMVTLSPSGQRMALVVHDAKGTTVYARQIDGPILMAAPVGASAVDRISWAGDNIVLVRTTSIVLAGPFIWSATGDYAANIATRKVIPILKETATVNQGVVGFYGARNLGSRWYGYYSGTTCAQQTNCQALFRVDLETGRPSLLDRSDNSTQWAVDEAGAASARLAYDERTSHWRLTSLRLGRVVAEGAAGFDGVRLWALGHTQDTAAVLTRGDDGFYTLFEAPLLGVGQPVRAVTQGEEVEGDWTDPDTGRLTGYCWWDGACHYVFYDPAAQKRANAALAAFRGYRVTLTSASRDFSRFVAYTDGGDDSGTYWLVDIASGKARILGSAYPLVPPAATGPVSVFHYKAADGLPMEAVLTLPPGRNPTALPLVVLVHGGPEKRTNPGFDWLAQAFASRGYAVLEPNFRGSSGYGKAFRDAGFGQWGRKMQTDVSDGVDALAAAGVVDAKRACIMGFDYGGYAAAAGVTLQQGHYRCAVSYLGFYDLRGLLANQLGSDNRLYTKYWTTFLGADRADASLDQISPVKWASRSDAPILLVEPKRESILLQQAPQMERALRAAGKAVETVTTDSDDWGLRTAATRTALLNAAVPFVEKYDPSGAP